MEMDKTSLIGKKFGHLTVIAKNGRDKNYTWECLCDCGNTNRVSKYDLIKGIVKSCGCRKADAKRTHGMTKNHTYTSWMAMRRRCKGEGFGSIKNYVNNGITVCERWANSFENFLEDMGERPQGKTLDRIDNKGNYEPNNCRWATHSEQRRNSRQFKMTDEVCNTIKHLVKTHKVKHIAEIVKIDVSHVYKFLREEKKKMPIVD